MDGLDLAEHSISTARWRAISVVVLTLVMLVLVELHVRGVNGPWYGVNTWRRFPALMTYSLMLLTSAPVILAVWSWHRVKRFRALLLLLPMLSAMGGKLVFAEVRSLPGRHLIYIAETVDNPWAVSYYNDATALSNFPGWLADFPTIMPHLDLHSKTKAPGMILYYLAFLKVFGHGERTEFIAGITIGVIAAFSIPACYFFLLALLEDKATAFFGACFFSLCPGFVLFYPASDPAYVIFSCALGICWVLALRQRSIGWSIAMGVMLALILVVSFNLLVFGLFIAGYALIVSGRPIRQVVRWGAIAIVVCVILTAALWWMTSYDPIATFISAWRNQHQLLSEHASERPYPDTSWNDLLDLALGTGWISFLLAGFTIAAAVRAGWRNPVTRLVMLCIAVPIVVAVSALMASETARVWNFMFPLLMVPVGIELCRQRRMERIIIFCCLALILAAICRNMSIFA